MTEINPMSPPLWLHPATAHTEYSPSGGGSRTFKCEFCDVTWKADGFKSDCWLCEKQIVIFNHKA